MKKKLNLFVYVIIVLIAGGCNAHHASGSGSSSDSASDNDITNGGHLLEVIADSALIIDNDAQTGQAKFYLENKSDQTINDIVVSSSSANIAIKDASNCHKPLASHETCEVSYVGKLPKDKNKDSANISVLFTHEDKYKSNGVIDILRNPDTSTPHFIVINTRARKNSDSELLIHAVGSDINKYAINSIKVNGHQIALQKNVSQTTLNGGENLSILVPTDVVNDTDPYTSQMELNLQGAVNNDEVNLMQTFIVGDAASGFIYEPNTGYINPTYNLNIATVGVVPQPHSVSYLASIPAGAVTDNTTHTFTASLQPTTSTASNLQCAQLISFVNNSCQVSVTGSGGTSSEVSNSNCIESIVIDPRKWGNTTQYLQCQYLPQIQDNNGLIENLNPGGVLTVNLSNMNNPVSVAMQADNNGYVSAVNANAGVINYAGKPSLPFTINGSAIKSPTYRWVRVYNYESVESVQIYYQVPSATAGQNASLIESPTAAISQIGSNATACSSGSILSPGSDCYIIMLVSPNGNAGIAGDTVNLQVKYNSLSSGRVSYYNTNLYMQFSGFSQYLGNMTTVVGGPNGVPFNESMPESSFITQAINGSSGGNTAAQCGKYGSSNNTYQCIAQGSYLNIKLPVKSSVLPAPFRYVLGNQAALTAQGFKVTYSISNSARPQDQVTYTNNGCLIPAFTNDGDWTCYISVQNVWSKNNTARDNIGLNVVGYFDANPSLKIENNWVNFFAINPTSKVLSMYNYTTSQPYAGPADTQAGGDTYWNSGESWGLVWNAANPDSTSTGTGRFFLYRGDPKCVADKVTGLLWLNQLLVNQASYSSMLRSAPDISCGGVVVANAGLNNGAIARSRLPSLREMSSIIDFRYNQTPGTLFGFTNLSPSNYNNLAIQNGTSTGRSSATGLSSVLYYELVADPNNVYPNVLSAATVNTFNWNGTAWSNNLGSSLYTTSGFLINLTNIDLINHVLVATLPTTELQPLQPLLKSIDPAVNSVLAGKVNCDAYCQESSGYRANTSNGGVGITWPTTGNWPNSSTNVVQNIYGKNRYVSDPTGNCMIDLATGLMFQQQYQSNLFGAGVDNADLARRVTLFNKANNAYYGLCGLKNWRGANIHELEATWNYAMDGQMNINLYKNNFSGSGYKGTDYFNPGSDMGISGLFYAASNFQGGGYVTSNTISSALNNAVSASNSSRVLTVQEVGGNNRQYFALDVMTNSQENYIAIPVAGGAARIQP